MRCFCVLLLLVASDGFAHGGGLDARGCHNDRKNGGYHCHRSVPAVHPQPSPSAAVRPPASTTLLPSASSPPRERDIAVVLVDNLRLRATRSTKGIVLGRLSSGSNVVVLDRQGAWWRVDPEGPLGPGYVSANYLSSGRTGATGNPTATLANDSRSDAEIAREIVAESVARYAGSCACPYSTDRAGRRCGARSAYSRPGGRSPMCYESDVPESLVRSRR